MEGVLRMDRIRSDERVRWSFLETALRKMKEGLVRA